LIKPFAPKFMKIGVLTAALQELTPRQIRDADPDRAVEDWLVFASELGVDYIQLSTALHPSESDIPAEALLDPVANTLDLRKPFDKARANRVESALKSSGETEEAQFHDPGVRCSGNAWSRCRLRIRGTESAAQHGSEPDRLRRAVHTSSKSCERSRTHISSGTVPDARVDDRRQFS
jgi:hypothetical protein